MIGWFSLQALGSQAARDWLAELTTPSGVVVPVEVAELLLVAEPVLLPVLDPVVGLLVED